MAPRASQGAMKKARFSEEQKVRVLRKADMAPATTMPGVSGQTTYA